MADFDIRSLMDFDPPAYLCLKCKGIITETFAHTDCACPTCGVVYDLGDDEGDPKFIIDHLGSSTQRWDSKIYVDNLLDHCRELGEIAEDLEKYPGLGLLFKTLDKAQKFVHFTTYGMSHAMIGAMRMLSERVKVRGIVSNVEEHVEDALGDLGGRDKMKIKVYNPPHHNGNGGAHGPRQDDPPHQKLIVIDGLLAITGSVNLTQSGWRKAENNRESVEVITNVSKVAELNNKLFSTIWAEDSNIGDVINLIRGPGR